MSIDFLKFSFSNGSSAITVREAQDIKARAGVHAWLYDKAPVMIYSPFMSAPERLLLRIVFSRVYIFEIPKWRSSVCHWPWRSRQDARKHSFALTIGMSHGNRLCACDALFHVPLFFSGELE